MSTSEPRAQDSASATSKQMPARLRRRDDYERHVPVHVVWEITLACNLKCIHCGSRAGRPRPGELSTEECVDVVDQLARLGTREITLIGGEAYLRKDWTEIIRAIRGHGIYCAVQSGGRALTDRRLEAAIDAGLQGLGVSIDGLPELHDRLRGVEGSYDMAISALRRAKAAGLRTSVNTQIGALTLPELPELMQRVIDAGATHWQLQLTVAMGNAVDHDDILLQPYQVLELMPLLARLYREGLDQGFLMMIGNNLGYFGPHEHLLRGHTDDLPHWGGCSAGQTIIGLEADGTVKGCPSLATHGFAGGNVRDLTIEDIWNDSEEIHFGRMRSVDDLWGFCRTCYYNDLCRGGCTWTTHSLLRRPGNNPYCHYRALELEKQGLRERIAKKREAPLQAFAIGEFELITEPIPGRQPVEEVRRNDGFVPLPGPCPPSLVEASAGAQEPDPRHGRVPPRLEICRGCHCYVWPEEEICPHCGGDIQAAAAAYAKDQARREKLIAEVERLIGEAKNLRSADGPSPGATRKIV